MKILRNIQLPLLSRLETIIILLAVLIPFLYWGPCISGHDICFNDSDWADYRLHYISINSYLHSSQWIPPYQTAFTWPNHSSLLYADAYPIISIILWPIYRIIEFPVGLIFPLLSILNSVTIAICSILLSRRLSLRPLQLTALSFFLLTSPISWWRLFSGHESLQLHSLVILPLTLIFLRIKANPLWWALLIIVTGINPYYLPFALSAYFVITLISYQSSPLLSRLRNILIALILCTCTLFLCGYIPGYASQMPEVWGANVLSLLNPQGTSTILNPIPISKPFEHEGYSYLGISIVLLATYSIFNPSSASRTRHSPPLSVVLLCALFLVLSWGLTWNISSIPVVDPYLYIGIHKPMVHFYGVFRSAGRFMWPIYYFIVISSIVQLNYPACRRVFFLILAIQFVELVAPMASRLHEIYANRFFKGQNPSEQWIKTHKQTAELVRDSELFLVSPSSSLPKPNLPPPYTPQTLKPSISSNWGGVNLSRRPITPPNFLSLLSDIPPNTQATIYTENLSSEERDYIYRKFTVLREMSGYLLVKKEAGLHEPPTESVD